MRYILSTYLGIYCLLLLFLSGWIQPPPLSPLTLNPHSHHFHRRLKLLAIMNHEAKLLPITGNEAGASAPCPASCWAGGHQKRSSRRLEARKRAINAVPPVLCCVVLLIRGDAVSNTCSCFHWKNGSTNSLIEPRVRVGDGRAFDDVRVGFTRKRSILITFVF